MVVSSIQSGLLPSSVESSPKSKSSSVGQTFDAALNGAVDSQKKTEGQEALPLEAYSLPDWYAPYIPPSSMLSGEINHAFFEKADKYAKDGVVSEREKAELQAALRNDPIHQARLGKERFRAKYSDELNEYHGLLNTYFKEALAENGIESSSQYYEKVVLDKQSSATVHQSMHQRLANDPRALELMNLLGASL